MNSIAVIGLQWGDEGKGKVVDFLASDYDCVVRFQGGSNAGHTIVKNGKTYKLSSLPSGVLNKKLTSIISAGVVVDPISLIQEIDYLHKEGITINNKNLFISENCHLVLSIHKELDGIYEKIYNIGTTLRGIGTCYEDKVARRGIRIADLYDINFLRERLKNLVQHHNMIRTTSSSDLIDVDKVMFEVIRFKDFILHYAKTVNQIYDMCKDKKLIFEGAQGVMLDVDYGTYPFVTSSSTISSFNSGLPMPKNFIGVVKAYTTRVGCGPLVTEQQNEIGQLLQKDGNEFGTVTSRVRRCGWFDAVAVRHAIAVTGVDKLILTKIDVLDGLPMINVCNEYVIDDQIHNFFPSTISLQDRAIAKYIKLPGWEQSTKDLKNFDDLPLNAQKYIQYLEQILGVPIIMISTGSSNDAVICV